MPFLVQCPSCGGQLRANQPVPAGREINCPKCKSTFTLTAPAPEIVASAPVVKAPPIPKPREEEIPDAVLLDDEDERPKSRSRRAIDDDEPPRSRRRPVEVDEDDEPPRSRRRPVLAKSEPPRSRRRPAEEDEAPRSRQRRVVDDDSDERPISRRRDEDDEDERRPKRRQKGKKKKNKGLLIGLVAGIAALFVIGGAALMYFVDPFGMFGGTPSEMTAWIPPDAQMVMFKDFEASAKADAANVGFRGGADTEDFGVRNEDVAAILVASQAANENAEVQIIRLKSSGDRKKIVDKAGGTEATAEGKAYYKLRNGGALHFASDRLLIGSRSESALTALFKKRGATGEVKKMVDRADGLFWVAITGNVLQVLDPVAKQLGGGPKRGELAVSTLIAIKASGRTGSTRIETTYDSSEIAKSIADKLRTAIAADKTRPGDIESFDVSTSGSTVILKMSGPLKQGSKAFPVGF